MDRRAELLQYDDEEETGNSELRQYYIENLPSLLRIPLYSIPTEVIHEIAVWIHSDDDYPEKWRTYATDLGIRDNSYLEDIEQTAKARGVMAMEFALRSKKYCHGKSFGHLIKIFLEKRLDILRLIYVNVQEILKNASTTQAKRLISVEEQLFSTTTKETESAIEIQDLNSLNITCNGSSTSGISFIHNIHKDEHNNYDLNDDSQSYSNSVVSNKIQVQEPLGIKELRLEVLITIPSEKRTAENYNSETSTPVHSLGSAEVKSTCTTAQEDNATEINTNSLKIINNCVKNDTSPVQCAHKAEHIKREFHNLQNCRNLDSSNQIKVKEASGKSGLSLAVLPSAPVEESLKVLIQHTEVEKTLAEELSTILRDAGFIVRMLSDIEHIIMMDAMGALSAIFQEVDFIVPVVSETFLEQIRPCNHARYIDSQDSINNRSLYKMYMNEFQMNRCVNFRIKPVLIPELSKSLVRNDLILSFSLRLWTEVPKLIRVLRETQQLIQNFPHH